ncbi:regulator of G-protein signaling 5-like [Macrotis lagotis]|uniref:regulator of G-protein signaling 5-like n=1 Tax=Macrotis lagotis TaxID=92651 RepID=UPI003D697188
MFCIFFCRAKEIKTKLGTLLQKPDATIDFIIPYPDKPEKPVKTQKPSPEEALQWRDSLEKLLQNHCKSWLLVGSGKLYTPLFLFILLPLNHLISCDKIVKFPSLCPCLQVNIDHFTKDVTMKNLVEPSPSSFDMAQKRIHALMENDSLPRFIRSEFYQELIK